MPANGIHTLRQIRMVIVVGLVAGCLAGCTHPLVRNLDAFRAAKARGDYEAAKTCLATDARIWFDKKEGPGAELSPRGGPYKEWDREFRSKSTREKLRAGKGTVSCVSYETNDYYRLLERTPTPARITYYFDDDRKITGMLYQRLSTIATRPPDRLCEFERWAGERYPGLLDSDEMKIPRNPKRWRELLVEFRRDTGLPPIE